MSDRYELKMQQDESYAWSKGETLVKGSLAIVCAALTEAIKYPPPGLISIQVRRIESER